MTGERDLRDRDLRDRLAALADAVPVRPPAPAPSLERRPVTLGSALRAPVSRSWLPVALVAVLVVAAVGILASGSQPAYGPVVETVRQGDFELTLRADKGRYAPGEPIEIEASLAYVGPDPSIRVGHAFGARQSAVSFGIVEPVIGDLRLQPGWDAACTVSELLRDGSVTVPFQKSGGYSGEGPRGSEQGPFMSDPVLRLEPGAWHIFAVAEFSIGECGPPEYRLEAEIAITVGSVRPPSTNAPPSPTEPANPPQSATVRDGDFELTMRSDKTRYAPNEAIGVTTSLTYLGTEELIEIGHHVGSGPLVVAIREPVYGVELQPMTRLGCTASTLQRGIPLTESGLAVFVPVPDGPAAESFRAFFFDPVLRLPVGTWHVYAWAQTRCLGIGPSTSLEAEITIVISEDPLATPGFAEPTPVQDIGQLPVSDERRTDDWRLLLSSARAEYRTGEPISVTVALGYVGPEPSIEMFGSSGGPYYFGVQEVGGLGRGTSTGLHTDYVSQGVVQRGEWKVTPFPELLDPWLPPGTWELRATTGSPEMTVRIVITVTE